MFQNDRRKEKYTLISLSVVLELEEYQSLLPPTPMQTQRQGPQPSTYIRKPPQNTKVVIPVTTSYRLPKGIIRYKINFRVGN